MAIQYCNYDIKGTLAVAGNATFSSSQIYLTGGLTSAAPSQYLGRVTGGGGGVMVGRTAAQVVDDIGAVATVNEGIGINTVRLDSAVTISVNYDSGDTDNLIFGSNSYTATVASKPYTPYILVADSNPGVSIGEVKSLRIQSIPINLLGDATGNVDMGGFRIIDVSDPSLAQDAATKAYVDNAISGVPQGTVTGSGSSGRVAYWNSSSGITSDADLTFNGSSLTVGGSITLGSTSVGSISVKDSGTTYWQVFKSGSATYMTTAGSSSDSIYLGAPTSSVTTNLTVSGNIQTGNTGDGSLTLKDSGTMFMQMFRQYSTTFINTGINNSTIYFGNTTSLVQNVNVAGFLDADNFKINNVQGASGQVMTSTGTGVSWQTPTSGTVTGAGAANRVPYWSSATALASNAGFTFTSNVLYVDSAFHVGTGSLVQFASQGDTDTGLGAFDGANGVSLVSNGAEQITVKEGAIIFDPYTSTSVATTGPLNANQNNQAPTQDTLATLAVDPSGNVVRGEQEATFTFTLAQLNSTLGQTLISAPGADKAVVITYTDWMMKYSSTGSTSNNLEIRQANLAQANASVSILPALRFNEIVNQSQSGSAPFYGFYTRDIPTGSGSQGRTYAVNKATTIHKQNSGTYPSGLTSISIKIRYRIFDVDTF